MMNTDHYPMSGWRFAVWLFWRLLVVGCSALLVLVVVSIAMKEINDSLTVWPTAGTMSDFLKQYTPAPVVAKYRYDEGRSSSIGGGSGAAGRHFVTRKSSISMDFPLNVEKEPLLFRALYNDVIFQLGANGATIAHQSTDLSGGMRINYHSEHANGSIVLIPIKHGPRYEMHRNTPLPYGFQDVYLRWKSKRSGTR